MNTNKNTNLILIQTGDPSDDGHGKYDDFYIRVDKKFTEEILTENYQKNKDLLGFGLKDFAANYEDNKLSASILGKLSDAGFKFADGIDNHDPDDDGSVYLYTEGLLEIAAFFIGNGLEGFEYTNERVRVDFQLFSGRETEYSIGYGLYY